MPDTLTAPAKINLALFITAKRADGYHDLESLFLPVSGLADSLEISPAAPGSGCYITPQLPDCPPENNLIHRAWSAFAQATGYAPDVSIRLTKRIPTGAGLGGGSSDAAAMLRWLQVQAKSAALTPKALNTLAAGLGADVPFFLQDGPAIARGIGDKLTEVTLDLSAFTLVLAMPRVHVATSWAYAAWDEHEAATFRDQLSPDRLTTHTTANKRRVSLSPVVVRNDFEVVVFPVHTNLRMLKEQLLGLGAACAVMSGSGAGIAALFRESDLAGDAVQALRNNGVPVHVETLREWGVAKR
jgi:4-diphosphocytidyl-2-C-methyl-D-erythritol kinase